MTVADVDRFEKLVGQLQSVYEELSVLSKKTPNDALNKFKIGFVNDLLEQSHELLTGKYRPYDSFEQFDEDAVPQNSDAVFILSQYLQCFEKLRADNVSEVYGTWYWQIPDRKHEDANDKGIVSIRTVAPKKLRDR